MDILGEQTLSLRFYQQCLFQVTQVGYFSLIVYEKKRKFRTENV